MNSCKLLVYFNKSLNIPFVSRTASSGFLQRGSRVNGGFIRCCSEVASTEPEKKQVVVQNLKNQHSVLDPEKNTREPNRDSPAIVERFNFSMYADESPLIQNFIDMGVNLYEIQKRPQEAQYLVTLSPEKVKRYVLFLSQNGISEDNIGKVITKNPLLFKEDLEDLQVRINYLSSKKFDKEMIATIITRNPKWLSTPVKVIDTRLGFLQQTFKLKGDDIRTMVTKAPGIALVSKKQICESLFALKEEMELDEYNLKKLILSEPALLRKSAYDFIQTFEYLTKVMKVSLDLILRQPKVLTFRKHLIQDRHKFLVSLGRAQYNNLLPGYVNLNDLVVCTDNEFCEKIAKTSTDLYYEFLKTL